jgi:NAD(P)H-hydrate repair Nnr-like enzyme with NAD(P)H-hydrate dehydratase domain
LTYRLDWIQIRGSRAAHVFVRKPRRHLGLQKQDTFFFLAQVITGAAAMTAMSAMHVGAGLVTLGLPNSINNILETQILEAMTFPLPETDDSMLGESSFNAIVELLSGKRCLAIGPGLGSAVETKSLVRRVIQESTVPIVIDADGINALAGHTKIVQKL